MRTIKILGHIEPKLLVNRVVKLLDMWIGYSTKFKIEDNSLRDADSFALAVFTDGTSVLLVTNHTGPYSDVTPDIDFTVGLYKVEILEG